MRILAIESSANAASVGVVSERGLEGEFTLNIKKTHSETLLPITDILFESLKLDLSEIDYVAVSVGPGSYTGLRIGVAQAKAIAYVAGVKCIPVSTLLAQAYAAMPTEGQLICAVTDARRRHLYTGFYTCLSDGSLEAVRADGVMPYEEIADTLNAGRLTEEFSGGNVIITGDGLYLAEDFFRENLSCKYFLTPPVKNYISAENVGLAALNLLKNRGQACLCEPEAITPEYIRPSQAERLKMAKKDISVIRLREEDVDAAAKIEKAEIQNPWSKEAFYDAVKKEAAVYVVAKEDDEVVGIAGMWLSRPEAEITNIAVRGDKKRKGIGSRLLETLISEGKKTGISRFVLEVRESNLPAIDLYEQAGFKRLGKREGFYENPKEDAFIYEKRVN